MKRLVIAGAGAGKTRQLIEEVQTVRSELTSDPYRYCAVITYTNAAANEIRHRLSNNAQLPDNLFVGTTHSFLTRFVLQPFSHLVGEKDKQKVWCPFTTPEKSFIDEVDLPQSYKNWFDKNILDAQERRIKMRAKRALKEKELAQQGVISYDKILQISKKILKKATICDLVASRIQYVFVDEYQDTRPLLHELFELIYKRSKTPFFYIGDPTQCIFTFASLQSQIQGEAKLENFNEIPIQKLKSEKAIQLAYLNVNHRSTAEIVDFTNHFNRTVGSVEQTSSVGYTGMPVTFLSHVDLSKQVEAFNTLIDNHEVKKEPEKTFKLLLSYTNDHFEHVTASHGLRRLESDAFSSPKRLREFGKSIRALFGFTEKRLFDCMDGDSDFEKRLQFRSFCLEMFTAMRGKDTKLAPTLLRNELLARYPRIKNNFVEDYQGIKLTKTISSLLTFSEAQTGDTHLSTIHKAKGLEATCVLASARSRNELKKWLDYRRADDSDDVFRLGYVAFTRARKLLSIACLEVPDSNLLKQMDEMKCTII